MRVIRKQAVQVHPVPDRVVAPQGPFPRELFREPRVVTEYDSFYNEDGSDFPSGATAQNNYAPDRVLRCSLCFAKVLESETQTHECEAVEDDGEEE